jgi:DNA polymerase/3'-5' exonuclease PolX
MVIKEKEIRVVEQLHDKLWEYNLLGEKDQLHKDYRDLINKMYNHLNEKEERVYKYKKALRKVNETILKLDTINELSNNTTIQRLIREIKQSLSKI